VVVQHVTSGPPSPVAGAAARGRASTLAALSANVGVAAAKFVAWAFTGSASMLAEAIHSLADTTNQALLLIGRHRSRRTATRRHPLGYGRERYFWSFIVAIVLFTGGAVFALADGMEKLRHPHALTSYRWALGVLGVSACFEGLSLRTARREGRADKRAGEDWLSFVRRTPVPELTVVILEDSGALVGLALAFVGTTLAAVTGEPRYDAAGSIAIGVLLALIAWILAADMKSTLIGEAADPDDVRRISEYIADDPDVDELTDLRTELLGPDEVLVVGAVTVRAESAAALEAVAARLEEGIRTGVPAARRVYLRVGPAG
jgi:cation diffusion facilitator family transporter